MTTQSERELLELAATAARFTTIEWQDMEGWGEDRYGMSQGIWNGSTYWNPRRSRADAFSLAVKLGMHVNIEGMEIGYRCGGILCIERIVLTDAGLEDAARLAITRAAAALAKED